MKILKWLLRHPKVLIGIGLLVLVQLLPFWLVLLLMVASVVRFGMQLRARRRKPQVIQAPPGYTAPPTSTAGGARTKNRMTSPRQAANRLSHLQ